MGLFFNKLVMGKKRIPPTRELEQMRRKYNQELKDGESICSEKGGTEGVIPADGGNEKEPKPDVCAKPKARKRRVRRTRKSTVSAKRDYK